MSDIRYGKKKNEVVRISDGLTEIIEQAMKAGNHTSKASFVREAIAFYSGHVMAKGYYVPATKLHELEDTLVELWNYFYILAGDHEAAREYMKTVVHPDWINDYLDELNKKAMEI